MSLMKRVSMLRKSLLMDSYKSLVSRMISKGVHMILSTMMINYVRMDAKYGMWLLLISLGSSSKKLG